MDWDDYLMAAIYRFRKRIRKLLLNKHIFSDNFSNIVSFADLSKP